MFENYYCGGWPCRRLAQSFQKPETAGKSAALNGGKYTTDIQRFEAEIQDLHSDDSVDEEDHENQ